MRAKGVAMKIGLIIAMDKEMTGIMRIASEAERLVQNAPYEIYRARYADKTLYVVKSGIGEIAAAAATQYLLTAYSVDCVLNFGICGKLGMGLSLLQTVVVDSVVHYQFDLSAIDRVEVGRYPDYETPFIPAPEFPKKTVLALDESLKAVVCASGDKFIADEEDKRALSEKYGAEICEMECAGVLLTCNRNRVPCVVVKTVSDDASAMDYAEFSDIAAEKHTELIGKILEVL